MLAIQFGGLGFRFRKEEGDDAAEYVGDDGVHLRNEVHGFRVQGLG